MTPASRPDDRIATRADSPVSTRPLTKRVWRRRWGLCVVSLLLTLLAAEVAVRVLSLTPTVYAARRFGPSGGVPFTTLQGEMPTYRPNAMFWSQYDPAGDRRGYFDADGKVTYTINRHGIRGPEVTLQKEPDTLRVMCLGDSFTFGEGVHYADTYPARLQQALAADPATARRVEVINAGVQAYGTKESVAFYLMKGRRFQPDVVTLGFVLNDASDFAETIRHNEACTRDVVLSAPARVSRLWEILERGSQARRLQREFFHMIRSGFESSKWQECQDLLVGMERLSREDGYRFVVMVFPVFWDLDGTYPFADLHARVMAACRQADCECIDLLEVYRGRSAESLWVHPTDQHPNELAHRLAAERLTRLLVTP